MSLIQEVHLSSICLGLAGLRVWAGIASNGIQSLAVCLGRLELIDQRGASVKEMFREASLTALEPEGLLSDAPVLALQDCITTWYVIQAGFDAKYGEMWNGEAVTFSSWLLILSSMVFKGYRFFPSIFNPWSMSLSFVLSRIFYISSALSPSPLNSIPGLALCLSPSAAGLLSH